ncbi:MAG TPA: hypothetical protein VGI66_09000 [Streptosporangiaceae bacterium]|jgi:hypothetical protein
MDAMLITDACSLANSSGVQLVERLIFQRAVIADTGIVDQDVESAEMIFHGCNHRLPVRGGSDITGHRDRIEFVHQPLKAVRPPGGHHDICARFAQYPRESLAQARRRSCNESHPARKKPASSVHPVIVPAQARSRGRQYDMLLPLNLRADRSALEPGASPKHSMQTR